LSLSSSPHPAVLKQPEADVYRAKLLFEVASCGVSYKAIALFKELVDWADLIHYHFPWPFADVMHFMAKITKPTIVTYHSDIVRQRFLGAIYTPLMNKFLGSVDRIVCTSPNYFATSNVLTQHEGKIEIIPIGITEPPYQETSDSILEEVRQNYGERFFLFIGVLRYYKGLHILLEAIKNAPYNVVIVGSGPTESELRAQAIELGLTNITFTGYIPNEEKFTLLKLCVGIVFPSYMRSEAFGVTLLEGAMCGKPLISTEVGSGTSHVNIDGETGLVVPPASPKVLRNALNQIWQNPQAAKKMGENARARYEKLFTGVLMGQRYADLYAELIECPSSRMSNERPS
jgi:rhamnosyl/mannosyltransferase